MSHTVKQYINGKWDEGTGETFTKKDPATGEILATFNEASQKQIDAAVVSAQNAFQEWKALPLKMRLEPLFAFEKLLEKNLEQLSEIISKETGKPLWESKQEVGAMRGKIAISIEAHNERSQDKETSLPQANLATRHRPHGVVAVFGPFNFPGHLPHGHIVPALIAGNAIILKPSEHAPLTAKEMCRMWEEVGLPKGVIQMILGGPKTGQALAEHPGIQGLFFTGSWNTGSKLLRLLAKHPEKILALEMGGNNPLIVSDISDSRAASFLTIQSAYITAGQRCTCARRLIISDKEEEFLSQLIPLIQSIRVGTYTDEPEPYMGPVISAEAAQKLLQAQDDLIQRGGKAIIPMQLLKKGTGLLSPGLIDVTDIDDRPDEELFGPILQLIRVRNFSEAIEEANQTAYGLAAGLLSDSKDKYQLFYQSSRAGIINWNTQLTGASSSAPFGGTGQSGNYRPSAYYATDYCCYPVASMEREKPELPNSLPPGLLLT